MMCITLLFSVIGKFVYKDYLTFDFPALAGHSDQKSEKCFT